jgi:hypothetical protein
MHAMEEAGKTIPKAMRDRLKRVKNAAASGRGGIEGPARREGFYCGGFGFSARKGDPLVIEFMDYPQEMFQAVAFVSA